MKDNESEEMYLETILKIKKRKPCVHSVDIVLERGFAKSSVSRAVKLLKEKGFITISGSGEINFTDIGYKKAESIYDRHVVLTDLLTKMGAEKDRAEENACKIEHVITQEMFEIIKKYNKKI